MAIKTMTLNPGDQPSKEEIEDIRTSAKRPVKYSKDAPKLTPKELSEFRPANPEYYKPRKELISLRLDAVLLDAFKSTGKGYQKRINEALWKGAKELGIIPPQ
ncbi:BrnA antitoxin family protein [Butyrivibrio sp. AE3009]|uniref:BrnA antitoxin family protein n=1 Tax=Butyrivibrio sp. AE3009 TaxID=1280666 RepID=UPI0003B72660|nr:BrnA antitoxin family protein [Butyrivibrio sp. AE3009]